MRQKCDKIGLWATILHTSRSVYYAIGLMIINQLYIKVLPTSSINREARRVGSKLEKAPSDDGAFFITDFSMCYNSILLLCFTLQCTFFRECTPKSVHNEAHHVPQLQKRHQNHLQFGIPIRFPVFYQPPSSPALNTNMAMMLQQQTSLARRAYRTAYTQKPLSFNIRRTAFANRQDV